MATVNLGDFYFNGPGSTNESYFGGSESQLCIRLSETYDIQTNKSTVSVTKVWFTYDGARGGSISAVPYFYIYINDEVIATLGEGNQVIYNPSSDSGWVEFTNISGTSSSIQHNPDGTQSATLKVVRLNNQWADATVWLNDGWNIGSCYVTRISGGEKAVTLTTIPRASSITSASNVTIGSACSVTWTPISTSFRYKLSFSLGNWSGSTGVINPGTTSSYTYTGYTIPDEVANRLPESTTGTMTVTLRTYSDTGGNTQIGSASSKTFTVTVPAYTVSWTNPVAASLVNNNSTIAGWNIAVQSYTAVRLRGSASGNYGSTISSYIVSGGYSVTRTGATLDYTGSKINSSGSVSFSVVAVDSRGRRSSTTTVTVTFYAYSPPAISSFTAYRLSSTPTSVSVKGVWSYSSVGNNIASGSVSYKLSTSSTWSTSVAITNNSTQTLSWTFLTTSSYDVKLIVTDSLGGTAEYTVRIPTGSVTLHLAENGTGVGIGKYVEVPSGFNQVFDVAWPMILRWGVGMLTVADYDTAWRSTSTGAMGIHTISGRNETVFSIKRAEGDGMQFDFGVDKLWYRGKVADNGDANDWTGWYRIDATALT